MSTHQQKANALAYVKALMEGTAGGYSPAEIKAAKAVVAEMFDAEVKAAIEELSK